GVAARDNTTTGSVKAGFSRVIGRPRLPNCLFRPLSPSLLVAERGAAPHLRIVNAPLRPRRFHLLPPGMPIAKGVIAASLMDLERDKQANGVLVRCQQHLKGLN